MNGIERTAYEWGQDAKAGGFHSSDCPYDQGTKLFRLWRAGFHGVTFDEVTLLETTLVRRVPLGNRGTWLCKRKEQSDDDVG